MLSAFTIIFSDWISTNWDSLKWPAFIVIFLIFSLTKKKPKPFDMAEQIENHPWIKTYYALLGLIIALSVAYILTNNVRVNFAFFVIGFCLLILPVVFISQREAYIEAGKKI